MKKIFFLISMLFFVGVTSTFGAVATQKLKIKDGIPSVKKNENTLQENIALITSRENIKNKIVQIFKRERKFGLDKEVIPIDGMAVAGFTLGFLSLFIAGFGLGILGAVFSGIALKRIKRYEGQREGRGLALAGLILSIVGFLGWSVYLLYYFEIIF